MSAVITALIDFPFIILLKIANIVSNTGRASTISGATITTRVYVFATPNIDITAKQYPKKFDPTSPINVFAGLKLNGKKPDTVFDFTRTGYGNRKAEWGFSGKSNRVVLRVGRKRLIRGLAQYIPSFEQGNTLGTRRKFKITKATTKKASSGHSGG